MNDKTTWNWKPFLVLVLLWVVAVGTGWTADGLMAVAVSACTWPTETANPFLQVAEWARSCSGTPETTGMALWALVGILSLSLGLYGLYLNRNQIVRSHAEMEHESVFEGRSTLVIGLSPRYSLRSGRSEEESEAERIDADRQVEAMKTLPLSLLGLRNDDTEPRPASDGALSSSLQAVGRHPWRQQIRIIHAHVAASRNGIRLRRIYIVPSRETARHAAEFAELAENRLADAGFGDVDVLIAEKAGIDYEDYDAVSKALEHACNQAKAAQQAKSIPRKNRRGAAAGICIDATAGQKVFSIAAAVVSLNRDLIFSYVNNNGTIRFYDCHVRLLDAFGS